MVVRRDSLRAQTDFFSPMTGNTSPRLAGAPRGKYGDEVKSRMAGMGEVRSTRTNPIQAAFVELIKTEDPFTEIDSKKSYAPEEEEGLAEALGGVGDGTSDIGERVEEFLEPITGGGGGGNKPNVISRNPNDKIASMSTQQLVDRDNRMYGNTVPKGAFNITKKPDTTPESDPGEPPKDDETRTYYGQGGLPLGTTTQRQGGQVKDGKFVGPQEKGPAINASGFQQKNVRGSTSFDGTGKDESARPKQTVASLPSDYKSTEAKAFAAAKSYKDSVAKGQAAAKATNTPTKPPAGSFGISAAGKQQAAANKAAAAKKKSESSAPKASAPAAKPSAPKPSINTSQSRRRGSSGSSGKKGGGGSGGGGGGGGGGSSSGGGGGSSSGGGGSSSSSSTKKGGINRSRNRRRCDIRTKIDISVLTNEDLLKDDLANVAYFVKELQETN